MHNDPVNLRDLWGLQCLTGSDQQDAGNTSGIGEITGYPETGNNSWRAANDQIFIDAANDYKNTYGLTGNDSGIQY